MTRQNIITIALTGCVLLISPAQAATRYAKTDGATTGNCDTWANACTLTHALTVATSGDDVWVKQGTYSPIDLVNGVRIIGGFAGSETAASQSNPATRVTTIDGGGTQRCVGGDYMGSSAILRGFRIANCHNGDTSFQTIGGGGLYLENSDAVFVHCVFENNTATWFGGAVAIKGSGSPKFFNCEFRNNGSGTAGSAQDNDAQPIAGGAVYLDSGAPVFVNCLFYNNKAAEGAVLANLSGSPTFVNCTIVKNYAKFGYGGGLNDKMGKATLRNCILWDNTAIKGGAQVFNTSYAATTVTYSNVQGGFTGTGNINSDPVFVNASSNDYKLQCSSPCRDTGINSNPSLPDDVGDLDWDTITSEPVPKDLALVARVVSGVVDLGAYELTNCAE